VPLVTATPRRDRVRVRARGRAGPTPLHPGAPQHSRTPIWGQGRAFDPVHLRRSSPPPSRMPASPRPCRGRTSHARGRQGEGQRFLGRHGHTLPSTEPRTHAREPTADAALAATHGDGPELRRVPHSDALSRPTPHLAVTPTLAVVCALRVHAAAAHTPARSRIGVGRQRHRRAAIAAPAPVPTSPRRPSPRLVHVPSRHQPQGGLVRLSCGDQTRRRRPRRRQDRAAPPSPVRTFRRTPWATFKTAGGGVTMYTGGHTQMWP
jgi:hypothetical protein